MKLTGHMILERNWKDYRGVDRKKFEPLLIEGLMDPSVLKASHIWEFYPNGWRRDLYRIFEENGLWVNDELYLVTKKDCAKFIANDIPKSEGEFEAMFVSIYSVDHINLLSDHLPGSFIGFDIAYLGGDFFSAVRNGLFAYEYLPGRYSYPIEILQKKYLRFLNANGLFFTTEFLSSFIDDFKENAESERSSTFHIYALSTI